MEKSLIFVGPQGSGKGTQARLLVDRFGYVLFETGAVLREMAQEDSPLGNQIREITTRGDLVSNEVVMEVVRDFVAKNTGKKIIFDGIPRSEEQRISLEALLEDVGIEFQVVEITLSQEKCVERLMKRAEIEGRADDNPESIAKRLENFQLHTKPLIEAWRDQGRLIPINGDQSPTDVDAEIQEKLGL